VNTSTTTPLVITAQELATKLNAPNQIIIDVSQPIFYQQQHIPGAYHLPYEQLIEKKPPAMGMLPNAEHLSNTLSQLGITKDTHIIAYDNEGGANASRLLWILDIIQHPKKTLLNGSMQAWNYYNLPTEQQPNIAQPSQYTIKIDDTPIATKQYILDHLNQPNFQPVDARTLAEYTGEKAFAQKGGHIPNAAHFEWIMANDPQNHGQIRPVKELEKTLNQHNITKEKNIVCYCQTNRRSAYVYWILKTLNYPNIKAYPGSWSEWGNSEDTPVTTGNTQ